MAFVPTYESIGIAAAWVITICRALQGMSSMGEFIGAGIYLTETTPLPARYPAVAWLEVSASVGGMAALGIATFVTAFSYDWRPVFFFGATVAVVGSVARTTLRETPEFIQNMKKIKENKNISHSLFPQKMDYKTILAMFFVFCSGPVWFYFVFIYCGNILTNSFGYEASQLLQNNFIVSIVFVVANIVWAQLSYRVYPFKILKFFLMLATVFVVLCPYLLDHASSPWQIMALQMFVGSFEIGHFPGSAIFYRHFPVLKRMTLISMGFATAKAFMFVVISFGLIYLNLWMGHWGLWVLMIPSLVSFAWALKHFEKIDLPYKNVSTDDMEEVFQEDIISKAA